MSREQQFPALPTGSRSPTDRNTLRAIAPPFQQGPANEQNMHFQPLLPLEPDLPIDPRGSPWTLNNPGSMSANDYYSTIHGVEPQLYGEANQQQLSPVTEPEAPLLDAEFADIEPLDQGYQPFATGPQFVDNMPQLLPAEDELFTREPLLAEIHQFHSIDQQLYPGSHFVNDLLQLLPAEDELAATDIQPIGEEYRQPPTPEYQLVVHAPQLLPPDNQLAVPDHFHAATTNRLVESRPYHPMNMAVFGPGRHREPTARERAMREESSMSANYRGDPRNARNHSDWRLPDEHNCSFWLENLPPNVDCGMILGSLRDIGRVYALHINNGECGGRGRHHTAGAKLTFFTIEDAQRFFQFSIVDSALTIGGLPTRVLRNRVKVGPQSGLPTDHTRVLVVTGSSQVITVEFLETFFREKFVYQLETVIDHGNNGVMSVLEWRFSSWRAQAHEAMQILKRDPVFQEMWVNVEYGRDPCALHEEGVDDE